MEMTIYIHKCQYDANYGLLLVLPMPEKTQIIINYEYPTSKTTDSKSIFNYAKLLTFTGEQCTFTN